MTIIFHLKIVENFKMSLKFKSITTHAQDTNLILTAALRTANHNKEILLCVNCRRQKTKIINKSRVFLLHLMTKKLVDCNQALLILLKLWPMLNNRVRIIHQNTGTDKKDRSKSEDNVKRPIEGTDILIA